MKVYNCIQGSTEWLDLRAGIPTSSDFDKIVTSTGRPSKQCEAYLYALLAEKMMGHARIEYMSHWMDRGSRMEADAVAFYELQTDQETVKVGFITNDEGTVGTSPDRLVGNSGLLEIKTPSEAVHVAYLLKAGSAYEAYRVQTQGQLWISGREWNDLLSYHPEMVPAMVRIERDEPFIRLLASALEAFTLELDRLTAFVESRGWMNGNSKRRRISEQEELIQTLKDSLREMKVKS